MGHRGTGVSQVLLEYLLLQHRGEIHARYCFMLLASIFFSFLFLPDCGSWRVCTYGSWARPGQRGQAFTKTFVRDEKLRSAAFWKYESKRRTENCVWERQRCSPQNHKKSNRNPSHVQVTHYRIRSLLVMKNLESHGISIFHFQGLESHGI